LGERPEGEAGFRVQQFGGFFGNLKGCAGLGFDGGCHQSCGYFSTGRHPTCCWRAPRWRAIWARVHRRWAFRVSGQLYAFLA